MGAPYDNYSLDQIRQLIKDRGEEFKNSAPTSASQAAEVILNGVKENQWRILIGEDAKVLDQKVRSTPEKAYDEDFLYPVRGEEG